MRQFDYLTGFGFDIHPFSSTTSSPENKIMLCGIPVVHPCAIQAHSDGDVALHALVDALLGTIAQGDIGTHFSPADSRWRNADSLQFLHHALTLLQRETATLIHVDLTIVGESPKIGPYKQAMRHHLAQQLQLDRKRVSIKATTTDRLGCLGRQEGIAAYAIATVKVPRLTAAG